MPMRTIRSTLGLLLLAAACTAPGPEGSTEAAGTREPPSTERGEWPHYTADLHGTRYSPLDQIDASNFDDLEVAWTFKTDNLGNRPEYKLEGTPLMVGGKLFTTAGTRRAVIALDAKTGELLWMHSLNEGARGGYAPRQLSGRGLSYWTDGQGDERVLYVTPGYRLVALDAKTGNPIPTFGDGGIVDLKVGAVKGAGEQIDVETGEIGLHSAPTVVRNMIIVGSAMKEGFTVETSNNTKGLVRAFDVRTGAMVWRFNTIPRPGEFGNETWLDGSWERNGNTGVWTQITVDEENELVYLPVESPTSDFYGGSRPGDNLFGESLVAVDLNTGERRWHFQFVHHPIWDHDMSSAPLIADVEIDGRMRQVVAVPSKQSYLYVFDRITGEPIWPIEEVPMPAGDVPGEWYAPTQPIPTKPPKYGRNTLEVPDDVIDFTPAMRAQALETLKRFKTGPIYNPPVAGDVNGILGAILVGNASGGTNWPGGGMDPETGIVYAPASTSFVSGASVTQPPEGYSDIAYLYGLRGQTFRLYHAAGTGQNPAAPEPPRFVGPEIEAPVDVPRLDVDGLPIVKPPYGVLSAIDLSRGELLWSVPHGDTPDQVRNHPALRGMNIPKTGQRGSVGLVVTRTLVIMGDPQVTTTEDHPRGAMLRAYDKQTGEQVGAVWMPASQSGSPMTYMVDGRQYIVVAVSGGPYSGEYIAFALPES
ncbi:MAG TPA: PQQ-binding-like beta-propeller repeat protein [Longimicrobiales bacterium]|nr:PQQ-binding-like beta-propeller repeat protein [Longimicrobiales bacterium]